MLAVAAGLARHVLVFRTVVEGSGGPLRPGGGGGGGGGMAGSAGPFQFMIPYGAASAACWVACYARRHMHDYGTTRNQLGAIAVNGRANAAANPKAIYTDPMTIDDYLAVRMVSDPLCLYDCDVPCDGSTAVVVSHRDYAGRRTSGRGRHQRHGHRHPGPALLGPVRRPDVDDDAPHRGVDVGGAPS